MNKLILAGKIIPTLCLAFFLFMAIGEAIGGPVEARADDYGIEGAFVTGFLAFLVVAVIWTWKNSKTGKWLFLYGGIAFSIFGLISAGHNHWFAATVSGLPYIFSAGLIMMGERLESKK